MRQKHLLHAVILAVFYISQFSLSEGTGCGQRILLQSKSHGRIDTMLQHYTVPCQFYIAAPTGQRIQINFIKIFNTGYDTGTKLELYEGNATQKSLARSYSSGVSQYPFSYLSRSNQIILIVKDVPGDSRQWNFQCEYLVTSGCKMKFRQMEGALNIPDSLDEINGDETCSFDITAEANKKISLIFSEIHLGSNSACSDQSLRIYEGQGTTKVLSKVRCQQDTRQYLSNTNSLSIVLKTKKNQAKTLKIYYVTGAEGCNRTYTESSGMISTPFFPHSLPRNLNCHYQIRAASGNRIFLKHKRNNGPSFTRVYEGMFDTSKASVSYPFPYYDHGRWQTPKYISESNILTVTFITGSSANSLNNQFYYSTTVGCNFNFSFDVGYVGSPRFPLHYPNNMRCNYTFEVQHGERFYVWTDTFKLQPSVNCQADKFSLHEGPNLRLSVCGSTNRYSISSVTNKMFLLFKTNEQTNAKGFMVRHAIMGSGGDRCYSYDVINDWKKQNLQSKCDTKLVNGWYRFNNTAGGLLPNKCPSRYSCGHIWVLGKMPTVVGTTTSLQACARFKDDCCYDSWTIYARKCSVNGKNFFIYYLRRPILCFSYCNDNKKDECMLRNNACHANALCSTNPTNAIVCICKNGYHGNGISCTDDNECTMGTHDCDRNAICRNTEGSFLCICKTGFNGNGRFCTAPFPLLAQSPLVSLSTVNNSSNVAFKCSFDRGSSSTMARYNVSWFIKEQKLHVRSNIVDGMSREEEVITLSELRNRRFQLGDILFCSIESFYANTSSMKSNVYMSKPFLIGFKVRSASTLTISEKDKTPLEIIVVSTIPIFCIGAETCSITLSLIPTQNGGHITLSHCQLEFKGSNSNSSQVKRFLISAQKKNMQDGDKIIQIDVAVHKIEGKITPYWRDHRGIENLQIIYKDAPFGKCSSTGDPHLTTFDNLYYHHYQVGEYVLLNNTCRQFEVHVRTFKCGSVSCNCGIAAREGNDVLIIDMCRDRIPKVSFPSKRKIVPNKSTKIKRDNSGRKFVIEFASGAIIEFNAWSSAANIYVTIPSNDFQCTRGLCGTFDGKSDNDLIDFSGMNRLSELPSHRVAPSSFTESWKLLTGSSLFNHQPSKVICNTTSEMERQCICKYPRLNTTGHTDRSRVIRDCHETQNDNIHVSRFTAYKEFQFPATKHCGEQQQPQNNENTIGLTEDDLAPDYIYNPGTINVVVPTWPTRKGKTLNAVRGHCTNAIKNSQEGQTCSRLPSFKFDTFIDQCVEDIKISDDFQFLMTAKNAMVAACKEELYTNASYWEKDRADGKSLQLPKELAGISCPGLCSGHGKCINGSCLCYAGFQSDDCSVDVLKGPEIKTIPDFSSCDQRKRKDCYIVRVHGSNFMNSKNLSCRVSEIQILGQRNSGSGKEIIVKALLISFAEIRCNLENMFKSKKRQHPYVGMKISVSNDGFRFSNSSLSYKVFDSTCMKCVNGSSCHPKNTSCNVDGYCFAKCESDQSDSESKCIPSRSTTRLSTDLSGLCGNASNANKTIVKCSNHYMQINLNKQYFDVSKYSSITLRDPTCKAKISNMYITLGSIPYLCGGERKQTVDKIIYENTVVMKAKPPTGIIRRDADRKIIFKCIYDRDGFITSKPLLPITKADGDEVGIGKFTFTMEMYENRQYVNKFKSYPVVVNLNDELFFQVSASVQDSDLVVLIDRCYSTPTLHDNHSKSHLLIYGGCRQDATIRFHPADRKNQRFSFKAFEFLGNRTTMIIHCYAFLCRNQSPDQRCLAGCPGNNVHRSKRDLDGPSTDWSLMKYHSKNYLIEAGPIFFTEKDRKDDKIQGGDTAATRLQTVIIGLVVGVGVLVLALALLFKKTFQLKQKVEKQNQNIGIDNSSYCSNMADHGNNKASPEICEQEV